ncbi:MAG: hypothetical protein SFU84_15020 [Gemmatimonadales bacterium]|nr:hypothetical protein [Gemmatimonadales bacterium]
MALPVAIQAQAGWSVPRTPIADIVSAAGAPDGFAEVIDARLLSRGGLVVADRRAGRLHFFDPGGRGVRSAGGRGVGRANSGD